MIEEVKEMGLEFVEESSEIPFGLCLLEGRRKKSPTSSRVDSTCAVKQGYTHFWLPTSMHRNQVVKTKISASGVRRELHSTPARVVRL